MISTKNRRAQEAFLKAIEASTQNHSFNAIELLASELDELNKVFQAHCPSLEISGQWISGNLSYAAEVNVFAGRGHANLLKFIMTPLARKEVMLVVQQSPYSEAASDQLRSHKIFKKLDDKKGTDKLFEAVRSHIDTVVPNDFKAIIAAQMQQPESPDIPAGHIEAKYGGKDAAKAYKEALYYQDSQHVGPYARIA